MPLERQSVAVDLDDVLFDFIGYFFEWHNQQYGSQLVNEDMRFGMLIWDVWGGTKEEAAERIPAFFQEVDLLNMQPMAGSVEALDQLKERYRLHVVSARDASAAEVSENWIDNYFPGVFAEVHLGIANPLDQGEAMSKAEMCVQVGAKVLIDDQVVHARECAERGIKLLVLGDKPWSREQTLPHNSYRVNNWSAAAKMLMAL